jgi:hypothetical protein
VARQQRISTESKDFYIDLVFYNYLLKCFVLFDLKTGELAHQDIGQMDMYVRMYDDLKTGPDDNHHGGHYFVFAKGCIRGALFGAQWQRTAVCQPLQTGAAVGGRAAAGVGSGTG